MIEIIKIVLSFVTSVLANKSSKLPDFLFGRDGIQEKLERTYRDAILKWDVPKGVKDACLEGSMEHRLEELKKYYINDNIGIAPKERELQKLWTEQILADPECCSFLQKHQAEIYHKDAMQSLSKLQDLVSEILAFQKALLSREEDNCLAYWDRKATAQDITLPQSIILGGREEAIKHIDESFLSNKVLYIKATTALEAKMFVVAAILAHHQDELDRVRIVDDTKRYEALSNGVGVSVVITPITEIAPWSACKKGHSVIVCVSKSERGLPDNAIELPAIDRNTFIQSLKESGMDDAKARRTAIDAAYDIMGLLRELHIEMPNRQWELPENRPILVAALLVGAWDDANKNDQEFVAKIAGVAYEEFMKRLQNAISTDDSPFIRIDTEWRVRTPRVMLSIYKDDITDTQIDAFTERVSWLLEDDDPDAIKKMNAETLQFWKDKHAYSSAIKVGAYHTITLLSLMLDGKDSKRQKIQALLKTTLQKFDLPRYLSNQHNVKWIAEAEPEVYLSFLEEDIKKGAPLLSQLFEIKKSNVEFSETRIFYTELLWCLEAIAWNPELLRRATNILLFCCQYPYSEQWVNRPINSLRNIYNLRLPQTNADAPTRFAILQSLSSRYPKPVYEVCYWMMKNINLNHWHGDFTYHFRWRWTDDYKEPDRFCTVSNQERSDILDLIGKTCPWDKQSICDLLKLSTDRTFDTLRSRMIEMVNEHISVLAGDDDAIHVLRNDILYWHKSCEDTVWALKGDELKPYQSILETIENGDIISKNKHYFDSLYLHDPEAVDYKRDLEYVRKLRAGLLKHIIDVKRIEGVWKLASVVQSQEAVATGLVELSKDQYHSEVYKRYVRGDVSERLTRRYFSELYYTMGEEHYISIIEELRGVNADQLAVVLYAPSYRKALADIADGLSSKAKDEYWDKVEIWDLKNEEVSEVLARLRGAGRQMYLLTGVLTTDNFVVPEEDKVAVLCELYRDGDLDELRGEAYIISEVLRSISWPQKDAEFARILLLEAMLYNELRVYLHGLSMHLNKEMNEHPELMMEFVKLAYLSDEEDKLLQEGKEIGKNAVNLFVWRRFLKEYHWVPCTKENDEIDFEKLLVYLHQLRDMMMSLGYTKCMPKVIGKILSDLPETEDYPSGMMCQLVEELNDDAVDNEIGDAVFRRRSSSMRPALSGGDVERYQIQTLEKYKAKAAMLSPRLVKVFDKEIEVLREMERMVDSQAERMKYML